MYDYREGDEELCLKSDDLTAALDTKIGGEKDNDDAEEMKHTSREAVDMGRSIWYAFVSK